MARVRCPELLGFLRETLVHEQAHRDRFAALLAQRGRRPCRATRLWMIGGGVLGLVTGLCGRRAVLVCTEAVEHTVHRHLARQVVDTATCDREVSQAIAEIMIEEAQHLAFAQARRTPDGLWSQLLAAVIAGATEGLIRLGTCGALARA